MARVRPASLLRGIAVRRVSLVTSGNGRTLRRAVPAIGDGDKNVAVGDCWLCRDVPCGAPVFLQEVWVPVGFVGDQGGGRFTITPDQLASPDLSARIAAHIRRCRCARLY